MASSKTSAAILSQMNTNFSLIKGIGPSMSGRLHNAGIHTFTQLASFSPIKLAAKVNGLSSKQIARQDWIGQARVLSGVKIRVKAPRKRAEPATIHHHYENFTIEFLLDNGNKIRRIKVTHVQSGNTNTWTGWEDKLLLNFLIQRAGAHIPTVLSPPKVISRYHKKPLWHDDTTPDAMAASMTNSLTGDDTTLPFSKTSHPIVVKGLAEPKSILILREIKVVLADSDMPTFFVRQDQPYLVRLILDLSQVVVQSNTKFMLKAAVSFKQVGGEFQSISETNKSFELSETEILDIGGTSLPPGLYRLSAFVRIARSDQLISGIIASLDGNLLQVY